MNAHIAHTKKKMNKLKYALIGLAFVASCTSVDEDPLKEELGLSARLNSTELIIKQTDGANYAKVNGSTQVNVQNHNDEGFLFYLGSNPQTGNFDLETSSISVVYTAGLNQNYKLQKGELKITKFEENLLIFKASFSGIAYKNTNPSDSVEVSAGSVNLDFN